MDLIKLIWAVITPSNDIFFNQLELKHCKTVRQINFNLFSGKLTIVCLIAI